jgi:hypothetical protein
MNYTYVFMYVIMCANGFVLFFMKDETFYFFFQKKFNGITDYNNPNYTGGIEYIFNPFHLFQTKLT